jgi:transmembrane sensor
MEHQKNILQLIEKLEGGTATPEELKQLDEWYTLFESQSAPFISDERKERKKAELFARLKNTEPKTPNAGRLTKKVIYTVSGAVAAILLIVVAVNLRTPTKDNTEPLSAKNDVKGGGNEAILTLASGEQVKLNDLPKGNLETNGFTKITKLAEGLLSYQKNTGNSKAEWNTISTPIGGQYQLILSDGTKVWLNAASSIRFPTKFNKVNREVYTTGEAYFEVKNITSKNRRKIPFKVFSGGQAIEVLGTQFNVNAYADQDIMKTTLIEGSVRLSATKNRSGTLLRPGEHAENNLKTNKITVSEADVESDIAWKTGFFRFNQTKLTDLMKQLERWYPIEVVYDNDIPNENFFGKIDRSYTLSEVLKVLQLGKLNFKIENTPNKDGKRKLFILK